MLNTMRVFLKHIVENTVHSKPFLFVAHYAHIGYFAFVFVEGHGIYAQLGGIMAVVTFMAVIVGGGDEV